MGAVSVVIEWKHAAVQQVHTGGQRMLEIRVPVVGPCINDTDFHMHTGGSGPGLRGMNRFYAPGH
ncbi:hypothetical protein D3C75_1246840 [compost metagenome]